MELEHNIRWTKCSIMLDNTQKCHSSTRHGIGFKQNSLKIEGISDDKLALIMDKMIIKVTCVKTKIWLLKTI